MLLDSAFLYADKVYKDRLNLNGVPLIAHSVQVALELARNGADDSLIAAGLLSETLAAGITEDELQRHFPSVPVEWISLRTEDSLLPWEERKKRNLLTLEHRDNRLLYALTCADILITLREIEEGLTASGEEYWSRLERGRKAQSWLFHEYIRVLYPLKEFPLYGEYCETVRRIFD